MTTEIQELPEVGEIVIATVSKVSDHGAYVTLDEYNNIQGFLHVSEIAPGWVRNISRYVKEGEKKVLLVKKVRSERSEIDLSLKQISKDQKKKKLLEVKRYEKKKTISAIEEVSSKIRLPSVEIRGILEITNSKPDGVEIIKKILSNAIKNDDESKVEITYVGAPKYRITVSAQDFKAAEKTLKPIVLDIQESIEKQKGTFNFVREDSKKTREG